MLWEHMHGACGDDGKCRCGHESTEIVMKHCVWSQPSVWELDYYAKFMI